MDAKTLKAKAANVLRQAARGESIIATVHCHFTLSYLGDGFRCEQTLGCGEGDGSVLIPSEQMKAVIATLEGEVKVKLEGDKLIFDSNTGTVTIPGTEWEDKPYLKKTDFHEDLVEACYFDGKELAEVLGDLANFTGRADSNPAVACVTLDGTGAYAIDGYRIVKVAIAASREISPVLFNKKPATLFSKARGLNGEAHLARYEEGCELHRDDFRLYWKDKGLTPIELAPIIEPFKPVATRTVKRKELLKAAETIKKLGGESGGDGVAEFYFSPEDLRVHASCAGGTEFSRTFTGEGAKCSPPVGFNPGYLVQHLKGIRDEEIKLEVNSEPTSPLRIISDDGARTDFILPIVISKEIKV